MTTEAARKVRALAEHIKTANRGHDAEIDRLADEIVRVVCVSPKKARGMKFTKLIFPETTS